MKDYWGTISERFDEWTAPLRPSPEDVQMFKSQLQPVSRTLLLGVTPELQPLATLAVDNNPRAIERHRATAILGDWRDLPFEAEFDAALGDGSLNVFQGTAELFFQQTGKVLKKKGRLVLRVFISPEIKEDLPVKDLYHVIKPIYDHPTLELYRESDLVYYFPKLSELPPWDKIQFGTSYELAERCPVITWLS